MPVKSGKRLGHGYKEKDAAPGKIILVNDRMQRGYEYELSARPGSDFADGFEPEVSPAEMLALGVFEGHYCTDCAAEFPREWFERARMNPVRPDIALNHLDVKSRQSLGEWRRKGWIYGPDVRGWFQWYMRYWLGRRLPEVDAVQVKRWRSFRRHRAQVVKACETGELPCHRRQRQALLQWAYRPDV